MCFHVLLGRISRVLGGVSVMTMRQMSVVSCLLVIAGLVMLRGFTVMMGSLCMMMGSLRVVMRCVL